QPFGRTRAGKYSHNGLVTWLLTSTLVPYLKVGTFQWEAGRAAAELARVTAPANRSSEGNPMSLVITGATGHLGRLVVADLHGRSVPVGDITAAGRDLTKFKDLADRGVRVQHIDYDDPASLDAAFRGADRILLISASVPGDRARLHGNAIDAAARAGA